MRSIKIKDRNGHTGRLDLDVWDEELQDLSQDEILHIQSIEEGPDAYNSKIDVEEEIPSHYTPIPVTITREDAMQDAGDLFVKLVHPLRYMNEDLKNEVEAWISDSHIELLDEDNRNRLWWWCKMHSASWAEKIEALPATYPDTIELMTELDSDFSSRLKMLSQIAGDPNEVQNWVAQVRQIANTNAWLIDYITMRAVMYWRRQSRADTKISELQKTIEDLRNTSSQSQSIPSTVQTLSTVSQEATVTECRMCRGIMVEEDTTQRETSEFRISDMLFDAIVKFSNYALSGERLEDDVIVEFCTSMQMSDSQRDEFMERFGFECDD